MNRKDINKIIDYGWRSQGQTVRICEDHSLVINEDTHQIEKTLRKMSMEYFTLDRCLQCGVCTSTCPNTYLKSDHPFSPRAFIQRTRLGLLDMSKEELWQCTQCGHCRMVCPFEIDFPNVMVSLRNLIVEQGAGYVPISIKGSLSSLYSSGNPWKEDVSEREKWLRELNIPNDSADSKRDVILFLGCFPGYDRRSRKAAEAAMRLLHLVGIHYEILDDVEVCCGDTARRVGDISTFERLRQKNEENILKKGIKDIVTLSPHCTVIFQEFYKWDNQSIRINPLIKILHEEMLNGRIKTREIPFRRITFHDPCYLSKRMGLVNEPRDILDSIPGLERVEMEHTGHNSLCCGGGGGGIWRDVKKGERLAEIRLDEALNIGSEVVITSCPYCLFMLNDAVESDNKYENLRIMDICELLVEAL